MELHVTQMRSSHAALVHVKLDAVSIKWESCAESETANETMSTTYAKNRVTVKVLRYRGTNERDSNLTEA